MKTGESIGIGWSGRVVVVGGGAAGFFAACTVARRFPQAEVVILEKGKQVLSKVRISGGGRCNLTNGNGKLSDFLKHYPRGAKLLRQVFAKFWRAETMQWFEERGVALKTESDGRMFPASNDSGSIVDCLMSEATRLGVILKIQHEVTEIVPGDSFLIRCRAGEEVIADRLIITSGGSPSGSGYQWLQSIGHKIIPPVPSLFTFNLNDKELTSLSGVVAGHARVKIQGNPRVEQGPLLITHWGLSGPAVLRLSAWLARELHAIEYRTKVQVNWCGMDEETLRGSEKLALIRADSRLISNRNPLLLPSRLWDYLLNRAGIRPDITWRDLSAKDYNRLINTIVNDVYSMMGKTTFKEEFVTCGGIASENINPASLESLKTPGIFFAGEVLDIDGLTGGYNFQAAWSTGFVAGHLGTAGEMDT